MIATILYSRKERESFNVMVDIENDHEVISEAVCNFVTQNQIHGVELDSSRYTRDREFNLCFVSTLTFGAEEMIHTITETN